MKVLIKLSARVFDNIFFVHFVSRSICLFADSSLKHINITFCFLQYCFMDEDCLWKLLYHNKCLGLSPCQVPI